MEKTFNIFYDIENLQNSGWIHCFNQSSVNAIKAHTARLIHSSE